MTCGIYKIENEINGKIYIGQSVNIKRRWKTHQKSYKYKQEHMYESHLYRSMRKYGIENFKFSILEECNRAELNEKERYWIKYYDSFFNGYNLTLGGDGSGTKIRKEKIIGIFYDLQNTNMTHGEIAKKWNISAEMVQGINTGRYWKRDDINYPIQKTSYVFQKRKLYLCCKCGEKVTKGNNQCQKCAQIANRKVTRPSREELKKLVRTIPFTKIAKQFGVSDKAICKWCKFENIPYKFHDIKNISDEEWEKI